MHTTADIEREKRVYTLLLIVYMYLDSHVPALKNLTHIFNVKGTRTISLLVLFVCYTYSLSLLSHTTLLSLSLFSISISPLSVFLSYSLCLSLPLCKAVYSRSKASAEKLVQLLKEKYPGLAHIHKRTLSFSCSFDITSSLHTHAHT